MESKRFPVGDGWIGIASVGEAVVLELAHETEQVYLLIDDPDELRRLAARLITEAKELQKRIEANNGEDAEQ